MIAQPTPNPLSTPETDMHARAPQMAAGLPLQVLPRPLLVLGLALIPCAPLVAVLVVAFSLPRQERRLAWFAIGALVVTALGIALALRRG